MGIMCLRFLEALYSSNCTPAHLPALPEEKRKFRYKECV